VGLEVVDGGPMLDVGAHGIALRNGRKRSIGYVTSSYASSTLGRPIALALIENGASRHGDVIDVQHLGKTRKARIAAPCALDPEGTRLNA
jgi:sarcosine oxidase subunit alpha